MNNRQRTLAILRHQKYDGLPIVHFGYWQETLHKWACEGHITQEQALNWADATPYDKEISKKLGFDFNWLTCFLPANKLRPVFEEKVIEEYSDGSKKVLNEDGVIILVKPGKISIPQEFDHLLKDRASWEDHYLPKLQFSISRVNEGFVTAGQAVFKFVPEGLKFLKEEKNRENPVGLFCGSLLGQIRNWLGLEGLSYLYADDEKLFDEIINTVGELSYKIVDSVLITGAKFDFAHFWEDICFKNGPLISPQIFEQKVGPHYKRITDLLGEHGIDIVSLDCDGCIDALIPAWLANGVNTMFPIEVGTWNASIKPWRQKYGKKIRGVGGMNKTVFSQDFSAIDAEVERLRPLVELGGYIPCPDHRIAPDAKWDNVCYYCDKMRQVFSN
ncbi:MAG: uroporphyrinogen decarboxylase family protein [Planctomycetaceae bacterium]|nr:uroporphyrinogen decarboxylase family protein [Planctomycetaceae bacterium]